MAPPPSRPEAGRKKKPKKQLVSLLDPSVTGDAPSARGAVGGGEGLEYTPIMESAASTFQDVADGESELWLIQLPDDVNLKQLNGASLRIDTGTPLAGGVIGSVTDRSGNGYALSEENAGVAQQMHVLVPAGDGKADRYQPVKRLTMAVNSTGIDGRPLFETPESQEGAKRGAQSAGGSSSMKKKKRSKEGEEASPLGDSEPQSASKEKHKKQKHQDAHTPGTSGREQDPEAAADSGKHQEHPGDASAEGKKKKKKKDKAGEQSAEKHKSKGKDRTHEQAEGQEGSAKKKSKKLKAADS